MRQNTRYFKAEHGVAATYVKLAANGRYKVIDREPKPEEIVVLTEVPEGFLDDLPPEDQRAINEIVGKPIALNEYDDAGRTELEFKDRDGNIHFIFVDPKFIRRI